MYMNRLGNDDFQKIFDGLQLNKVFEKNKNGEKIKGKNLLSKYVSKNII